METSDSSESMRLAKALEEAMSLIDADGIDGALSYLDDVVVDLNEAGSDSVPPTPNPAKVTITVPIDDCAEPSPPPATPIAIPLGIPETALTASARLPLPATRVSQLKAGHKLGKCLLTQLVARGTTCLVFSAFHTSLKIPVAVKVLLPSADFEGLAAIEPQLLARLRHPNLVQIYDYEEDPAYIVMEYVDGLSLEQLLGICGRLRPDRAVGIALAICAALGFAHCEGVLHRDLKPANVLLSKDGMVRVADLGIAKLVDESQRVSMGVAQDESKKVLGSPSYIAPERLISNIDDHRADIYSLGTTLYAMLTGNVPFHADTALEILRKQVHEAPLPLTHIVATLPEGLSDAVLQMLEKDPNDRPQSYTDVAKLLSPWIEAPCVEPPSLSNDSEPDDAPDDAPNEDSGAESVTAWGSLKKRFWPRGKGRPRRSGE